MLDVARTWKERKANAKTNLKQWTRKQENKHFLEVPAPFSKHRRYNVVHKQLDFFHSHKIACD